MNGIDAAIAQASAAAANIPAQNAGVGTAVAPAQTTAVAAPAAGTPMGLADAMAGMQVVDNYLKVSELGLQIGGKKGVVEEILVTIDMSEVAYSEAIKFGNPAVYEKTYDRVIAASGKPWAQAIVDAQKVDPKARPYRSADIAMTLVDDVTLTKETVEADTVLGHSLSTTGFKAFASLVKQLQKAGIDPTTATIKVTVGYTERSSNGNTWGILDFRNPEAV